MAPEKVDRAPGHPKDDLMSSGEFKIISSIFKNAKPTNVNVNWEAVCQELGFKNTKVGKDRFGQLCKKYGWFGAKKDDAASTDNSSPVKPRAPAGAAASKTSDNEDMKAGIVKADSGGNADVKNDSPNKKRKLDKVVRASKKSSCKKINGNKRHPQLKHYASDSDEA
ncbi:hypothetical protein F4806DRAFT_473696 [Annulohypoxylon nitens]|nr:hypothetical protein F4806DRAFT_473696 [Annulohypoxylon nitens]